jgi:hypothetical protein
VSGYKEVFFPSEMKQSEDDVGVAPIATPQLYKVPPGASDIHTLATLEIDESTIDGNLAVLEALATDQLGMTLEELVDGRLIPVSGCEKRGWRGRGREGEREAEARPEAVSIWSRRRVQERSGFNSRSGSNG